MQENRKFPRLDLDDQGELDIRIDDGERITLPVAITSISPHGASVSVSHRSERPVKGTLATLRFSYEHDAFKLPARVAWARTYAEHLEIGLELLLDLTPEDMRRRYARWIVNKFVSRKQP